MAKPIAMELKQYRESISRSLLKLQEKGFVECLKPKSSNYRPYKITRRGKIKLKNYQKYHKIYGVKVFNKSQTLMRRTL